MQRQSVWSLTLKYKTKKLNNLINFFVKLHGDEVVGTARTKYIPSDLYLMKRTFFIDYLVDFSYLHPVLSSVPQKSVIHCWLHFHFALPTQNDLFLAAFADDIGILSSLVGHNVAYQGSI